jgi:hypothetical protein
MTVISRDITEKVSGKTKIPQIWSVDDHGKLKLSFHSGQSRAWATDKRHTIVLAGTQGGKTSWGPWWLWREIQRRGSADYLVVTSSFELFKLKILPVTRECFEDILKIGRFWAGAGIIELADPTTGKFWAHRQDSRMWGRIILRSAMARGGLESTTAAAAWLDEAGQEGFSLDAWEAVQRRLSLYQGRSLITTTIYQQGGWLKDLYDRWKKGDPDLDVIQFKSTENPAFSQAEMDRAQNTMQGHRWKMFYLGEFSVPPGQIYHIPDALVVPRFQIPQDWPIYAGVDFGAVNTCTVWVAHDERMDRFYLFRERHASDMTTQEHFEEITALEGREDVICRWGGAPSERQYRMDWTNEEVQVLAPQIAGLEAGIDRVTQLIKNEQLYIFDDLEGTLNDLRTYSREMDDQGNIYESIKNKEQFHYADCVRYLSTGLVSGQVQEAPSLWG